MYLRRALVFTAAIMLAAGAVGSHAADKKQNKMPDSQQPGWNDAQDAAAQPPSRST